MLFRSGAQGVAGLLLHKRLKELGVQAQVLVSDGKAAEWLGHNCLLQCGVEVEDAGSLRAFEYKFGDELPPLPPGHVFSQLIFCSSKSTTCSSSKLSSMLARLRWSMPRGVALANVFWTRSRSAQTCRTGFIRTTKPNTLSSTSTNFE